MRLISWNVNRRVARLAEQAHAVAERQPDVLALQEITQRSWPLWRAALETIGLSALCSGPVSNHRTGVLIAARDIEPAESLAVPWPETTLAARVGDIVVHTAHVPNAANGWVKPDTLAALRAGLAKAEGPRVLCGDLNTPRREQPDGTVISFARDRYGRLREERGTRWDDAELGVVPGLRDLGFTDAFAADRQRTWVYRRWSGGYRLDHVFASAELEPVAATYRHAWRDGGLSDHSALEVELRRRRPRG